IGHETQASVLLKSRFMVEPVLALHRSSFAPRPNVDAVLLRLELRARPLVRGPEAREFEAFVRRGFARPGTLSWRTGGAHISRPAELTVEDWLALFHRRPGRASRVESVGSRFE